MVTCMNIFLQIHMQRVSICWQRTLELIKRRSDFRKWSTGRREEEAEGEGEGMYLWIRSRGFHGKSSAFNDGYVLLRNAIVRECLLRCHGRMPVVVGRILPNGITTGTIMAQSTRRWCGLAKEEDASVLGTHGRSREITGTKIYALVFCPLRRYNTWQNRLHLCHVRKHSEKAYNTFRIF